MKKIDTILCLICVAFIILNPSCKKEPPKKAVLKTPPLVGVGIDIQKIENLTGIQFKILKTEAIGYMPFHKFYWITLEEKVNNEKVKELADSIIKETIAKKPKTYHSFTIHFFWRDELAESLEKSKSFARANFLPEGGWLKVERIPINDYKRYELICTFFE